MVIERTTSIKCPLLHHEFIDAVPDEDIPVTLNKYANESEKILFDFMIIGGIGDRMCSQAVYFDGKMITYCMKKTCLN